MYFINSKNTNSCYGFDWPKALVKRINRRTLLGLALLSWKFPLVTGQTSFRLRMLKRIHLPSRALLPDS